MSTIAMYLMVSFIVIPAFFWLTCANGGWLLFLGLGSIVAAIFFVLAMFDVNIEIHKWLFYPIVSLPWVGMVVYQSYFAIKKMRAQTRK